MKRTTIPQKHITDVFKNDRIERMFKRAVKYINIREIEKIRDPQMTELAIAIQKILSERWQNLNDSRMRILVYQTYYGIDEYEANLRHLDAILGRITKDTEHLGGAIGGLNGWLHEKKINDVNSMSAIFNAVATNELIVCIRVLMNYFGYEVIKRNEDSKPLNS